MYYCPSHKYLTSYWKTILPNFFVRKMWFEQFFLPSRTHRVIWLWKYRHFCRKLACDSMCVIDFAPHRNTFVPSVCPIIDAMRRILLYNRNTIKVLPIITHGNSLCHFTWEWILTGIVPPLNVRIFAFQSNQKQLLVSTYSNYRKYVAN